MKLSFTLLFLLILGINFITSCKKTEQTQEQLNPGNIRNISTEFNNTKQTKGTHTDSVSFNHHIRPILADQCYACHGPDVDNQKSPFRLDTQENSRLNLAKKDEPVRHGIVPGNPEQSIILKRILHEDPTQQMPPPYAKKKAITPDQVALIRQWIKDGANYEKHWSFVPPTKPNIPVVTNTAWGHNPIDNFILVSLENNGIIPSPIADKETLIRRVYIDLTGLPPHPKEIDAFIADTTANSYETMVDRALASPHYGERMTIDWLDVSRYADTNALHVDLMRTSWPWRDWVINAFNDNMPYDQFIIEQLAGDLLPDPTIQQKIATSFNRHHGITNESGVIPEEFLTEYAVDRVSTMGSAFMGLTFGCARCHDHKFDPITQNDFFSLVSFFNNIPERGMETQQEYRAQAYPPFVYCYSDKEKTAIKKSEEILTELNRLKNLPGNEKLPPIADQKAIDWEALDATKIESSSKKLKPLIVVNKTSEVKKASLKNITKVKETKQLHFKAHLGKDPDLLITFEPPKTKFNTIRIEATAKIEDFQNFEPFDSNNLEGIVKEIEILKIENGGETQLEIKNGYTSLGYKPETFANAYDKNEDTTWEQGISLAPHHYFLELKEPTILSKGKFAIRIKYKGLYTAEKITNDYTYYVANNPHDLDQPIALIPSNHRTEWQKDELLLSQYHKEQKSPYTAMALARATMEKKRVNTFATRVMVMEENPTVKPTYVLDRGLYDHPLKDRPRPRAAPEVFTPLPENAPKNRLGLAYWLVNKDNPLTSRVTVNRLWQQLFKNGIVKTSEDFGLQSESPSHPELLDYLAVTFMENDWDVKKLMKLMVMSSTYRQSSKQRTELRKIDPENRLLAYSPRYRFPAELIRDNALTASGLLNTKIGGPSVKPYQPSGLWREKTMQAKSNTGIFSRDTKDKLYRRGLYTFFKQASPPPQMELFDAPSREFCTIKRRITNTPLQALALMNDETYLEISRVLATRIINENKGSWNDQLAKRLEYGLRLATGRKPKQKELDEWIKFTNESLEKFRQTPEDAKNLLSYGEKKAKPTINEAELAALTYSMSTVLNLDETINRD